MNIFSKFLKSINNKGKQWISVNNSLPKPGDMVVCTDNQGDVLELGFRSEIDDDRRNWIDFSFPVSYWYPIPELDDIINNNTSEIEKYDYIIDKIKYTKTENELDNIRKLTEKFGKNISRHNSILLDIIEDKIEKKSKEIKEETF